MNRIVVVLTVGLFASAGCGSMEPVVWDGTFHEVSGKAVLDTDTFTIVFDGIPITLSPGQSGGGTTGSLQVAGPGTSKMTFTAHDQTLINSYASGVNTISLGKYTIRITNDGQVLEIGGTSFDLGGEKKSIVVDADGSARILEP